ncbi:hypothetical protein J1N35_038403 [Gossypium stocksii]|uniref:3,4-dihydroxy-2-butanone-4-phosphate synthase n=1 Tax=Gossypium stocksii TaxID=47602 RepID=A0A9D3UMP0_9ROSI|nr:hypothetical protein J1N35_038403 [Gossypium stocksii]
MGVGKTSFVDGLVDQQAGIEVQPNAISFETLAAEITPVTNGFFADEYDLDHPTQGFASIQEAIEDIRQGIVCPSYLFEFDVIITLLIEENLQLVIDVDDEDRENEGDLIMAASIPTLEATAFIVKHGTGIDCVSMKAKDLERATTVLALASKDSKPEYFNRPGHIFPLKYREGGVLKRAGHTEASVDLAVLAGLEPVAVLCEIVDDDGSMARLPKLREFAQAEKLKIISIADLIRYRTKRERLVELAAAALISTMWGPFKAYCYRSLLDGIEHTAMVKILGDLGVHTMSLMTNKNNPAKYVGLKGYGLAISGRVPLLNRITKRCLETKQEKLGHIYGSDINSTCNTAYQEI